MITVCKLETQILKEAKNLEKLPKMILLGPKNDSFETQKCHFRAFLASFKISLSSLQHPNHNSNY